MKEYSCSKHGKNGEPTCKECWKVLKKFCKDKNVAIVGGEEEEKKAK